MKINEKRPGLANLKNPGALVQWLWEETRVTKVVGSNPSAVYWIDIFSHLFVVKIVMVEKTKINKNASFGHFFKKKTIYSLIIYCQISLHFFI